MKTLITIAVTVLSLLALQQIDVYLYNRQYDVNVIVAQYEIDLVKRGRLRLQLVELRNYRHWKPDVTDTTGAEPHNMFEATPIRRSK